MKDIVLENVRKCYGEKTVFDDLSHVFKAGSVTCITGPSGSGKTTLLRLIAGLEDAESGTLTGTPEKAAFVFQDDLLCEDFSAVSNIRLAVGKAMPQAEIEARLREIGITEVRRKPVRAFSGGMKRRVAIARAVCFDAPLLLMDEPFKGLDAELKKTVMTFVKKYAAGATVIFASHDPTEAEFLGGTVFEIETV